MGAELRTVAVVLAGGVGQRIGLNTPKQLIQVAGRPIIEHTLAAFEAAPEVDEILLVMTPGFTAEAESLVARCGFRKVAKVIAGGASRTESTLNALTALGERECDVLLHDAVRPLVEPATIAACVDALRHHRAVEVAIPSSDTMLVTAAAPEGEVIRDIPDRTHLRRAQTPQCFRLSVIREAYRRALADPGFADRPPTDDCAVVLRYLPEVPIVIVPGSEQNLKVTHPVDVYLADKLLQLAGGTLPAHGPEDHRAALHGRTLVIFGGHRDVTAELTALATGHGADVYAFPRSGPRDAVRVEDPADVARALDLAAKETGRIDYVVNAAAVQHLGRLSQATDTTVAETVGVNYLGPVNIARAALCHLRETQGHLLFCTSSGYLRGRAGRSLRSSTDAAVVGLVQALADEWAPHCVRVNCVNPERTAAPLHERALGHDPADGPPSPGDVALTTLDVLISHLTGQVIDIRPSR